LRVAANLEGNDATGEVSDRHDQPGRSPEAQVPPGLALADLNARDRQQQLLGEPAQQLSGNLRPALARKASVAPGLDRRRVEAPFQKLLTMLVSQPQMPNHGPVHTIEVFG
jgi:hypothetical protein